MSFIDALNAPLPSKKQLTDSTGTVLEDTNVGDEIDQMIASLITESDDDDLDEVDAAAGVSGDDIDDLDDEDDGDLDPDDLSDEELAQLDAELTGDALDAAAGVDDDTPEEQLSPSEELQADDMMAVAATTMLVNDELNAEERANFIESGEANVAVHEGFMTEADVEGIAIEAGLVEEAKYTNKMIIRLNAEAKKKQLFALAVNVSAAAHNDPDYRKLRKLMRVRKVLRARLTKKYQSEATKRMRIYFARLKKSRSPMLAKIGAKNEK